MYLRVILWEDLDTSIDEMTRVLKDLKARFGNVSLFSGSAQTDSFNADGERINAEGFDGIGVIIPTGNLPEYPAYLEAKKAVEACRRNCWDHPENSAYYEAKAIARRLKAKNSLSDAEAALLKGCLEDCQVVDDYQDALGEACEAEMEATAALEAAVDKFKQGLREQYRLRDPYCRFAMADEALAEMGISEEPKTF